MLDIFDSEPEEMKLLLDVFTARFSCTLVAWFHRGYH